MSLRFATDDPAIITTPRRADTLFGLFLLRRENAERRPATLLAYRRTVGRFLAFPALPPDPKDWRDDHLELWLAELRMAGLSAGTRAWYQRHVWAFIGWLIKHKDISREADPRESVLKIEVPRERKRTATASTLGKLIEAACVKPDIKHAGVAPHWRRNTALLRVLWSTGIRREELTHVKIHQLDLRAGLITCYAIHTKKAVARKVPLDGPCIESLYEYILNERPGGEAPGPLFYAQDGRSALSSSAMAKILQRLSKRAGIKASSHDFRRGFASRVRGEGLDLGHTARLLGHATLAMSIAYSEEGADDAAIAAYHRLQKSG